MRNTRLLSGIGSLLLVALAGYGSAAAQQPTAKPKVTPSHAKPATPAKPVKVSKPATPPKSPQIPKSYRGIAVKLNTTPEALESQYEAARAVNPKLTHGQFLAANVLAQNLGAKHPGLTVQAILDGLRNNKSIGQTLQSLKLSPAEAKEAEKAAERQVKAAERDYKSGVKSTKQASKEPSKPSN